uniref:ATP synthase CFO B chain subunit I n=1 Tax=Gelidium vagum TaxID=35171 RepID=A0A141SDZ0_GELVA|nr:ATP synthase CFO B chain subunit I [Gelidium vagum]AMK96508.1 ATP synthase CFO B chain subunit I [Gelidium vagum]
MMQTFYLIANQHLKEGFAFNTDFLEANVINIVILLSGLIYVLRKFLGSILNVRQEKVLSAISESEERLQQAKVRLAEAEKQLNQTQIIIGQIIKEAEGTAQKVHESILAQGKSDIERLTIAGKASILTAEYQVKQQIQQQIISLAINKVTSELQNQVTPSMQANIINSSIDQLGGKL